MRSVLLVNSDHSNGLGDVPTMFIKMKRPRYVLNVYFFHFVALDYFEFITLCYETGLNVNFSIKKKKCLKKTPSK